MGTLARLKHAWNAFTDQPAPPQPQQNGYSDFGAAYATRPDRVRLFVSNERSIISSIYARLSIDVAQVDIRHVKLDAQGRYLEDVNSGLHNCLNVEANIDQSGRHLKQDAAMSLFDQGTIAVVPVDRDISPLNGGTIDIGTMRVGQIVQWYPQHVKVDLYNDRTGRHEQVTLPKRWVAIVENPFYEVMNKPNSTLQRVIRKLNLLDTIDENNASGKLDMIIQLPYQVRSEQKKDLAEKRRKDIEFQLRSSKFGIAYIDGTEKVIQLNRPVENTLMKQVEYFMALLYSQLGITAEILNGTADEKTMLNYNNRTVEPVVSAFTDEYKRKFLSKTARTQGHSIESFRDPFKLVPMAELAELADKFTRNEIVTSNEFRQFIGMKPSSDPRADELRNSNIPDDLRTGGAQVVPGEVVNREDDTSAEDDVLAELESVVDGIGRELGVDLS